MDTDFCVRCQHFMTQTPVSTRRRDVGCIGGHRFLCQLQAVYAEICVHQEGDLC